MISTPMAMMASNAVVGGVLSVVRSVVDEPRRSPAEGVEDWVDWIWEAE